MTDPLVFSAHHVGEIISGGQTGVDRAALDVAIDRGISYAGWVPAGGWAEDSTISPGVLAHYPRLRATPTSDPAERTGLNVRDSDAILVIAPPGPPGPGTALAIECALRYGKPYLCSTGSDPAEVARWISQLGPDVRLNVAGPRSSEWVEGYDTCRALLDAVLAGP